MNIVKQVFTSILIMLAAIIAWGAWGGTSRWTLIAIYWSFVFLKLAMEMILDDRHNNR